jgi:hypothetical protein
MAIRGNPRRIRRWGWTVGLLLLVGFTACDDDPFKIRWEESPDTVLLYSLARPELNLLSGFDFVRRIPVRIESPGAAGEWDLALDTKEGDLVFLPPGALGETSKARIIVMPGMAYPDVKRAPSDTTLYVGDEAVPVELGNVYVIRTRQEYGIYGTSCVYYGKLEPLDKDLVQQSVTFQFDVSPVCNSRKLIPPKN